MKTKFIPIDYDYFDYQGRNYIKLVGKDEKNKKICIIDSCPIYMWAILKKGLKPEKIKKIVEKIKKIKIESTTRTTTVEKVEILEKSFLGKPVKSLKIFATNYKDLHHIASELGISEITERRGYDLGLVTHYIIEKKVLPLNWYEVEGDLLNNSHEFGGIDMALNVDLCVHANIIKPIKDQKYKPNAMAYDIETDELKIGEGEILMISLVGENFKKVITWKKASGKKPDYLEYVTDEAELLERFCEHIKEQNPDFLVGYFSDGFDLPYLKARAEHHKMKLPLGIDGSQPKFSRGITLTGKINGIVHIDLLRFIRTAYSQYMQSETLSLNEVAKEFLGDTKKQFEHRHSTDLTEIDWNEYFEYNLHDSVLTRQLFEKFWPDLYSFTKVIQEPIFDISRNGLSKQVESYLLHNLERFNEIPQRRPKHDEISERRHREKVEGAFVFEPKPGLYDDIAMFDFTSMHTSIIISMNISGPTLLQKQEKDSYEIETRDGKLYFSKKQGFIPALLQELFEQRKKYKAEYKKNPDLITKARSNAFKLLSASIHGYMGFFGARYYSVESSSAILAFVRKFNKEAISKIEKKGHKIIYGDTDSIAFLKENKSETEIKALLKKLNSELPGIMELELEGFFKRGLWVTTRAGTAGAKKKYAMVDENGKTKIRGFETVRRDWCKLARETQNKVIELILKNGNEKKAIEYTKKIIKQLKNREIQQEEIIIKTQLKKPIEEYKSISPHVVAAKKMKELEIPISQGNIVEYYLAETREKTKLVRDKVKLPQEKGKYNIKYYLERQILPAVENIFQVFDINLKEIIEGKKQTTLGDF